MGRRFKRLQEGHLVEVAPVLRRWLMKGGRPNWQAPFMVQWSMWFFMIGSGPRPASHRPNTGDFPLVAKIVPRRTRHGGT